MWPTISGIVEEFIDFGDLNLALKKETPGKGFIERGDSLKESKFFSALHDFDPCSDKLVAVLITKCFVCLRCFCLHDQLVNRYFRCKWLSDFNGLVGGWLEHVYFHRINGNVIRANKIFRIMNFIRCIAADFLLQVSHFSSHQKLREIIRQCGSIGSFVPASRWSDVETKDCLYMMFCLDSPQFYIGITNRVFLTRSSEHIRNILTQTPSQQIPAYKFCRQHGPTKWLWIPLAFVRMVSYHQLRVLEHDVISWSRSPLNFPRVNRAIKSQQESGQVSSNIRPDRRKRRPVTRSTPGLCPPSSFLCKFLTITSDFWQKMSSSSTKSLTVTALKLGDGRPKCDNSAGTIRFLSRRHPHLIPRLWSRVHRILDPKHRGIAVRRMEQVLGKLQRPVVTAFHLKLPYTGVVSSKDIFNRYFRKQVQKHLPPDTMATFKFSRTRAPSIKKFLCNIRTWCQNADTSKYLCSCDLISNTFGLPRSKKFSHACGYLSECGLFHIGTNMNTPIVPTGSRISFDIKKSLHHVEKKLGVGLDYRGIDHEFAVDFDRYYSNSPGVHEASLAKIKKCFGHQVVFMPVDKFSPEVAVCCPRFWQDEYLTGNVNSHTIFSVPPALADDFSSLRESMAYTGTTFRARHEFGLLSWWVKRSGFEFDSTIGKHSFEKQKWRPTGSYARHMFKLLLSTCCRAMNFVCDRVFPDSIGVCSFGKVFDGITQLNLDIKHWTSAGYSAECHFYKRDIENFFNNVDHAEIVRCWKFCRDEWHNKFGWRREFLAVPKRAKTRVDTPSVFTRAFKGRLRNVARDAKNCLTRPLPNGNASKDDYVINMKHILKVILFDLRCGYVRFGSSLILSGKGTCQGSPLAPGACCTVCVVTEHVNKNRFMQENSRIWIRWARRWVDDIFVIFVLFVPSSWSSERKSDHLMLSRCKIDSCLRGIEKAYRDCGLGIKTECADDFVGTAVQWCNDSQQVTVHQILPSDPVFCRKYQNYCAFVPRVDRVNVIVGQMASVLDRCIGICLKSVIRQLCLCFAGCGFPKPVILAARSRLTKRHPYLAKDLKFLDDLEI